MGVNPRRQAAGFVMMMSLMIRGGCVLTTAFVFVFGRGATRRWRRKRQKGRRPLSKLRASWGERAPGQIAAAATEEGGEAPAAFERGGWVGFFPSGLPLQWRDARSFSGPSMSAYLSCSRVVVVGAGGWVVFFHVVVPQ